MVNAALPLYRIRCYGDYLYRVSKRLFTPSDKVYIPDQCKQSQEKPLGKFDSALSRARNLVRELALCNRWEYFVTLTFDGDRWDRYDLEGRLKEFLQWVQNLNKQGHRIKYLMVPEFHEDGAVHFHALMSGIKSAAKPFDWPESVNRKSDGSFYDIWPEFSERYGFSSVDRIADPVAVGFYISKYISKSMCGMAAYKGLHTYYRSRGLFTAYEVGHVYSGNLQLDKICKFQSEFYATGFCKFDDIGTVVDLCDDVSSMYRNYLISDPVSGEVVAAFGGEEEDIYVQEVLEIFKSSCGCSFYDGFS